MEDNKIIIYTTEDGQVDIEVRLEDENVWLTQNSMAELFDTTKQNISLHIKNIFEEKELKENAVVKENLTTAKDGKNYKTKFYNLDLIISVGYRVKSVRGTQFRIWANKLIKEYLIKGYNLDVRRFKNNGGGTYFEEVLEKIRDIRSSEKVFWRKILDIYATSVDYDASKSGLISLTYDSAVQFAPYVRVNCVAPGWVNTEMNKELPEDFVKEETERILVKRFAEPKEIAKVVTFLASEDASFVNSTVIKVDGGWY